MSAEQKMTQVLESKGRRPGLLDNETRGGINVTRKGYGA